MDDLWRAIMPPADEPMFPVLPGDPYYPDHPVVYQPIPLAKIEPREDPQDDPEEEIDEEPKEDSKEDMDGDDIDEVIMVTD